MNLRVITAPTEEPVSTETAKLFLRVDASAEDTLIASLIKAAREKGEELSRRAFVTQTLEMIVDDFPPNYALKVARPRLQSVTSVTYYDEDNNSAVWTDYVVNARSEPGTIIFDSLPSVALMESGGVVVRFVAGYGAASAVPERIKNLILSLVAYWYENRESRDVPSDIRKGFVAERAVWF